MKGWVMATQKAFKNDEDLVSWLEKAKKICRNLTIKIIIKNLFDFFKNVYIHS